MSDVDDVVIIGGGAAGCAAAYYLAKAGVSSTIIEREGIASNASGFNAGGLNPLQGAGIPGLLAPLAEESFKMHQELAVTLPDESGVDFFYKTIVMINVAFEESEFAVMEETYDIFQAADGFSAQWLTTDELLKLEPRISSEAIKAVYTYGNATLGGYEYVNALLKASGAKVISGEVKGLRKSGGRVTGVVLDDGELDCGTVVVASGPWSSKAGDWLGVNIPVVPLKGEIVRVEPSGKPLKDDFSGAGSSLYQRAHGLIWVGATEESRGFDKEPSESAKNKLLGGATKLMPSLADARIVKQTACLRPVTPDWLPIVGKAPGWDNVYLSTGAGKKGILISPGMGKATSDLITSGCTNITIGSFAPERFSKASV
jgi:glycine oxidase